MTNDEAMRKADDALDQLMEIVEADGKKMQDDLEKLLVIISEEVFNRELPLDRIRIVISNSKRDKAGGRMAVETRRGIKTYIITLFRNKVKQDSWNITASTVEHECLHIFLKEKGVKNWKNRGKAFIYMAGAKGIQLYYPTPRKKINK